MSCGIGVFLTVVIVVALGIDLALFFAARRRERKGRKP